MFSSHLSCLQRPFFCHLFSCSIIFCRFNWFQLSNRHRTLHCRRRLGRFDDTRMSLKARNRQCEKRHAPKRMRHGYKTFKRHLCKRAGRRAALSNHDAVCTMSIVIGTFDCALCLSNLSARRISVIAEGLTTAQPKSKSIGAYRHTPSTPIQRHRANTAHVALIMVRQRIAQARR